MTHEPIKKTAPGISRISPASASRGQEPIKKPSGRNASPLADGPDAEYEREGSRMRDDLSASHARATQESSVDDPYAGLAEHDLAEEPILDPRPWRCTLCADRFAREQPAGSAHSTEWKPRS